MLVVTIGKDRLEARAGSYYAPSAVAATGLMKVRYATHEEKAARVICVGANSYWMRER